MSRDSSRHRHVPINVIQAPPAWTGLNSKRMSGNDGRESDR